MDSDQSLPPAADAPPSSSLPARLTNIFVSPGEVFDEINLIYSQDFARQQMGDMQGPAMRKQIEKVSKGKMTEAQIDQAVEQNKRIAYMVVTIGTAVGAPFFSAGWLFLGGVIVWLVGSKAM